jgi:hypothetical protein
MTETSEEVLREKESHGRCWNSLHGGYFASEKEAEALVDEIVRIFRSAVP